MKYNKKKRASLLLCLMVAVFLFSACSTADINGNNAENEDSNSEVSPGNKITIAVPGITGGFSPFFPGSDGDNAVMSVINVPLVTLDRRGEVVAKAAQGETKRFNGADYEYSGIADTDISLTENNTTVLSFNLRNDVSFSDGTGLTADDLIFTLYVLCDADYNGNAGLSGLPIAGIDYYRTNADREIYDKYTEVAADCLDYGPYYDGDSEEFEYLEAIGYFSEEQYRLFYECYRQAWLAHVQSIVDYCVINYGDYAHVIGEGDVYSTEWLQVALAMMVWRVADFTVVVPETEGNQAVYGAFTSISGKEWDLSTVFPTIEDFFDEFYELYDGDLMAYINAERIGGNDDPLKEAVRIFIAESAASDTENNGVSRISGIKKTGDYGVEVILDGHVPSAVYSFVIPVAPLHYYGDLALYNYNGNDFGFTRGNLSAIREKNGYPIGAGAYKIIAFNQTVIEFEANPLYYKGAPETPYLSFRQTADDDFIYGVAAGVHDIAAVLANKGGADELKFYNSSDLENLGVFKREAFFDALGYIGINAEQVNVDGETMSSESVNFRKGIATVFAAYRDISVRDFYGETSEIAEYPVSGLSFAAPRRDDSDYRTAFSVDVKGSEIYSDDMGEARRLEAAKRAALGFFEAAGCELNSSRTAIDEFPDGLSSRYEIYITGGGEGRHPSYLLLTMASETLRSLGINLVIRDVSSQGEMFRAVINGDADMWCAAWISPDSGAAVTPDLSKTFSSGGAYNIFGLSGDYDDDYDSELDRRIAGAEASLNLELYRIAFEAVLDSAVCVPVYQRKIYYIFGEALNQNSIENDLTAHYNYLDIIHKIKIS
ncbi:MAG: ABC transporter substrate-binding protein [Oscillospiraceae bacterium]|nr:ABC transporter substrate-binding protein [Oscillospiraceae bacterium]